MRSPPSSWRGRPKAESFQPIRDRPECPVPAECGRHRTGSKPSEAIGVTRPTLSHIENGKIAYTEERLERIADELQAHQAAILLDYGAPAQTGKE